MACVSPPAAFPPSAPRAEQPGLIPLRPLGVGEILGAGLLVLRRHIARLAGPSLAVSVVGAALLWALLSATGYLQEFVDGTWVDSAMSGTSAGVPGPILGAAALQVVTSLAGGLLVAGIATVYAAQDTLGRPTTPADRRSRMRGQWLPLIGVCLVGAIATTIGLALLIVPGILVYLAWFVAAPVAVLERADVGTALRRSALLTRGQWGRIFGIAAACVAVTFVLNLAVASLVGQLLTGLSPVGALLVSELVSAVVSVFAAGWAGAVCALTYIDLRIRRENLGPTLAAAARAS